MVTVRLPTEQWRDARQLAVERGQTLSELIRDALDLQRSSAVVDAETDADALERWRSLRRLSDRGRRQRATSVYHAERGLAEHYAREETPAPSPTVVAAARSAGIRRRQKRRKR